MLFNSLQFLIFFAIVYPLYLLCKRQHSLQNRLLLIASCIFYGSWDWRFLILMFITITTDFVCGQKIDETQDPAARKRFLKTSIIINFSILGFFKYFNFFVSSAESLLQSLNIPVPQTALNIILPVGISFYTFQSMSYTIDVYRREIKATKNFLDYALFVTYFPHLVAGPIMRATTLLTQVLAPRVPSLPKFYEGSFLIFWGLFEKIFIASNLAQIVNPIFAGGGPYEGGVVLVALYAFAFQIFCDFDAYSNIARGLGKLMGFEIMYNFNLPYFSTNPSEFWRRWHISLSTWLRDYLYISLGGNRHGSFKMYRNLGLTMLLGGLWHGAAWTYVAWGAYHGALLVVHRLIVGDKRPAAAPSFGPLFALRVVGFFHVIVLGWLLFRAQSMGQVGEMLSAMVFNFHWSPQVSDLFLKFAAIVGPLLIIQVFQCKTNDLLFLYHRNWLIKTIVYALMTYAMLSWGVMKAEEFIYFQF